MGRIVERGYELANFTRRTYWRIAKPERHGVKVFVTHPEDHDLFLAIRTCYGDTDIYTLPGGGYKPKNEDAFRAAAREVLEETGIRINPDKSHIIGTERTNREGKKDNITVIGATALGSIIAPGSEISEALWTPKSLEKLDVDMGISRFIRMALADN